MATGTDSKLRPVYLVYPALYPLLMLNYWVRHSRIPVVAITLSGYDSKIKGRILPFHEEVVRFIRRSGWYYTFYMLVAAKLAVPIVWMWGVLRQMLGKEVKIKTFRQIAQEKGIPIYRSKDFNSKETLNFLRNVNANFIVSAYNNQILKPRIFNFPTYKAVNIHPGALPDFRGLDAVFEALYHRVPRAGVTIHYIERGIDTGRIIVQDLLRIRKRDTVFSLNVRMWMHGAKVLQRVLEQIERGKVEVRVQNLSKAKYPYKSYPERARVREFLRDGGRFLIWRDIANTFK